jgi:hypothetical protein
LTDVFGQVLTKGLRTGEGLFSSEQSAFLNF